MLRDKWASPDGARTWYVGVWTDGARARLLRSEKKEAEPWHAPDARAADIRAFLGEHAARLKPELLTALRRALVTTTFLESISTTMIKAVAWGRMTIVGPGGRGTRHIERRSASWFVDGAAGYRTLEDAVVSAVWSLDPGRIAVYLTAERTNGLWVDWEGKGE